jgi:ABC-type Fe3+ transport system permease subunit
VLAALLAALLALALALVVRRGNARRPLRDLAP